MKYCPHSLFRVVEKAFSMANIRKEDISAIAVTTKPGLSGSLV
jgi:tRNA A37 threonylcarbamoyltransferase TsaD